MYGQWIKGSVTQKKPLRVEKHILKLSYRNRNQMTANLYLQIFFSVNLGFDQYKFLFACKFILFFHQQTIRL